MPENRVQAFIDDPRKALWRLAIPMIASMSIHTVYMIADFAFIGWVGDEAVAGITLVGPLFFVVIALLNGMGITVTALVAQALGRDDRAGAQRLASGALLVSFSIGIAFAAGGLVFGERILYAAGARGEVLQHAWSYFRILAMTVPLFFLSSSLRSVLQGEGDARLPMAVMAAATVVNLALDGVFVVGMEMGVAGAALATMAAQILSLGVFGYLILIRRRTVVRISLAHPLPTRPLFLGLWRIGLPTAAGQLIMSAGGALNNRLIADVFGDGAVAGYGAASRVDMIVAMPIFGVASAAVTLTGMFAGARRPDLVRSTALYTYRWVLTFAVLIGVSAYLASEHIIRIFVTGRDSIAIGRTYLGFMLAVYPMMAFGATTGRVLQGLGRGMPSLVITAVRILGVGVPVAYISVYGFGAPIEAVWIGLVAGALASTALSLLWVRRLIWRQDPTEEVSRRGGFRRSARSSSQEDAPEKSPTIVPLE